MSIILGAKPGFSRLLTASSKSARSSREKFIVYRVLRGSPLPVTALWRNPGRVSEDRRVEDGRVRRVSVGMLIATCLV
jgi:hypothetical protein